jgi:hypothetical protein
LWHSSSRGAIWVPFQKLLHTQKFMEVRIDPTPHLLITTYWLCIHFYNVSVHVYSVLSVFSYETQIKIHWIITVLIILINKNLLPKTRFM